MAPATPFRVSYDEEHKAAAEKAMSVPCRYCGAKVGQPCSPSFRGEHPVGGHSSRESDARRRRA